MSFILRDRNIAYDIKKTLSEKNQKTLETIKSCLNLLIAGVLIVAFNPFYKIKTTEFHKEIGFSAGIIILTTSTFTIISNILIPTDLVDSIHSLYL
jgi:hypothetical protein